MASEHQPDMLGDDSYSDDLLDTAYADIVEDRTKWPKDLAALYDIYEAKLAQMNIDSTLAQKIIPALLIEQANYGGGRVFYLGKAEAVRLAIRDRKIWQESYHHSPERLAEKYRMSLNQVYVILRTQTALHRAKIQPQLPLEEATK